MFSGELLMKKSQVFKYVLYKKMLFSYVLILSLTILIISSVLYFVFSNISENNINNRNFSMLTQVAEATQIMLDDVIGTCYSLYENNHILTALYSENSDSMETFNAVSQLRIVNKAYPYIEHIGLYNSVLNTYIGTRGIVSIDNLEPNLYAVLKSKNQTGKTIMVQTVFDNLQSPGINTPYISQVITLIIYSSLGDSAIIVDIPQERLLALFEQAHIDESFVKRVFIYNNEGYIISDINTEYFNTQIDTSLKEDIASQDKTWGSFNTNLSNGKHIITYTTNQDLGWVFVIMNKYGQVLGELQTLRLIIASISLAILLIGILYSYFVAKRLHSPIDIVLDNLLINNFKDKSINEMLVISKALETASANQNLLQDILKHSDEILFTSDVCTLLNQGIFQNSESEERINKKFIGPYYCSCSLYPEVPEEIPNINDDKILNDFIILNIVEETLSIYDPIIVRTQTDEISVIMQSETPYFEGISNSLTIAQDSLTEWFNISFSAGVGTVTDHTTSLCESYVNAQEALNLKYTLGPNVIIFYENMNKTHSSNNYPTEQEKFIFISIGKYDVTSTINSIHDFINCTKSYSSLFAKIYGIQLVLNIISKYQHILVYTDYNEARYYNTMINSSDIKELESILIKLCTKIINELKDASSHDTIIEKVKTFIDHNYMDSSLCLNSTSKIVSLSPPYVNRLFKLKVGRSFNEYLNDIRINKSKDFLSQSDFSSADICKKIGMSNNTYFYTLFKQKIGMTPSQYRTQMIETKLNSATKTSNS